MSLKLYITRHGQTEWNIENRLQGWRDSNLTEKGIEDAVNLSERLKDVDFTHIYTSTQKRAIETAKILRRKRDIKIIELDELKEIGFGEWEGIEKEELLTTHKDQFDIFLNKAHLYRPSHNAESYQEIYRRVESSLDRILKSKGENILIVSHGVTIKIMTSIIKGIPLEELHTIFVQRGTALNICEVKEDNIKFIVEGDTSHVR